MSQPTVIMEPPTSNNSEKPAVFRQLINPLPQHSRLELFSRHHNPSCAWGNQIGSLDQWRGTAIVEQNRLTAIVERNNTRETRDGESEQQNGS
ncbi:MAG: hypothetical protein F6K00_33495 [Leptolyngbya sp. SIOISBB]|nr:hypothetical protein [Leptolyngbya sp. SIOISBB]